MTDPPLRPIDFASLDKGSVVTAEEISAATGVPARSRRYPRKQIELCSRIEWELAERDIDVTAIVDKDIIRVLTDAEALKYLPKLAKQAERKFRRAHGQMLKVNAGKLSADDRRKLDREQVVLGAKVAALRVRLPVEPTPYVRNTPGLPKPAGD